MTVEAIVSVGIAYLVGSIPFGFIVARARGIDLRKVGSGNVGATNVFRALGLRVALGVFALDVAKGFAGTRLVSMIGTRSWQVSTLTLLCGLAVILGAVASIFLRLRGGKGVASGVGVFLGLNPAATGICLAIWAIVVAVSRYVSLGSICGAVALPILVGLLGSKQASQDPVFYLALAVAAIVIIRHRANIRRLARGTENKIALGENR